MDDEGHRCCDRWACDGLRALIIDVLHDHGPLSDGTPQTERWQDCPRADAHDGSARRIIEAWSSVYVTRGVGGQQ